MEQLRKELLNLINEKASQLPPEAVYYVFKDVFRDLSDSYNVYLKKSEQKKQVVEEEPNKED